jgi:cleavage and polyadenylation specificity factor subunit 1
MLNAQATLMSSFSSYEMLPLEEQLEIANQIGTTRSQILSSLSDLSLGTSFL